MITPEKNGKVRIGVNTRAANQAITRERHPLPTVDDLIHTCTLNGATVFSKLDLRAGCHQVPLSPESQLIHYYFHNPQRSVEIYTTQFWHQLSQQDIPVKRFLKRNLADVGTSQ